jgi:hypothetical protein
MHFGQKQYFLFSKKYQGQTLSGLGIYSGCRRAHANRRLCRHDQALYRATGSYFPPAESRRPETDPVSSFAA